MSFDNQVWPLNLEIELDGASGFKFGSVVTSTFLPPGRQVITRSFALYISSLFDAWCKFNFFSKHILIC